MRGKVLVRCERGLGETDIPKVHGALILPHAVAGRGGIVPDRVDAPPSVAIRDAHAAASRRHCGARCARTFPLATRPGAMLSYARSSHGTDPSHRRNGD